MEITLALERLEAFKSLEEGWDSYGGKPPSHIAIEKAKELVKGFFVCPVADGTISISLGSEDVTLIVDEQGGVSLVIS